MSGASLITSPASAALDPLCDELRAASAQIDARNQWPAESLKRCGDYGVYQWFVPRSWGGQDWSESDAVRGYIRLSAACMTTAFILTQRTAACRWLMESQHPEPQEDWLGALTTGERFATVGISHFTTSRRHLARPVVTVEETADKFVLDGYTPWVTGASHADVILTGGELADGRQVLLAVPTDLAGVTAEKPAQLVALSASHTGPLRFDRARVPRRCLVAGPVENVMTQRTSGSSGGLQTSALAVGLSSAAVKFLEQETAKRPDLAAATASLREEYEGVAADLLALAAGAAACSKEDVRARANSLVLRVTQAALTAAKGSGFVVGHPTGRWCREALFFLVWSCPQPVMNATLCELAGLS